MAKFIILAAVLAFPKNLGLAVFNGGLNYLENEDIVHFSENWEEYRRNEIDITSSYNFISLGRINGKEHKWKIRNNFATKYFANVLSPESTWNLLNAVTLYSKFPKLMIVAEFSESNYTLESFTSRLRHEIKNSDFFQENFLVICIRYQQKNGNCFMAYRIDSIANSVAIKQLEIDSDGLIKSKDIWSHFQADFDGSTLNVAGVNIPWYYYDTSLIKAQSGDFIFNTGFSVEVLFGMRDLLNFKIRAQPTNSWGTLRNGSWDGMIAEIIAGKSDLGISSTANLGPRTQTVDFNMPTHEVRRIAMFKRSSGFLNYNAVFMPFSLLLWITIVFWMIACAICHEIFQLILRMWFKDEAYDIGGEGDYDSRILFSVICKQTTFTPPKLISMRILYVCELLVSVILNALYSGVLISFLSVENNPIKTVNNLLSTDYKFLVSGNPTERANMISSDDPIQLEMINLSRETEKTLMPGTLNGTTQNLTARMLLAGKFVFISDNLSTYQMRKLNMEDRESCQMQEFTLAYGTNSLSSFVKKNSKIKRRLDYSVIIMTETGNIHYWEKKHLTLLPWCDSTNGRSTTIRETNLQDIRLAFQILWGGFAFSAFLVLMELIYSNTVYLAILNRSSRWY